MRAYAIAAVLALILAAVLLFWRQDAKIKSLAAENARLTANVITLEGVAAREATARQVERLRLDRLARDVARFEELREDIDGGEDAGDQAAPTVLRAFR